jgi:molecular chaperone IbpA
MTNHQIVRFDTTALNRAFLGFDELFNEVESRFANQINTTYPPYNVIKHSEDSYELEIAVTGFDQDEISVEIDQNQLIVKGQRKKTDSEELNYQYRGLASRDFTRHWTLAQHMEVREGTIKNGVLTIGLERNVPEALKPRILKLTAK